ncbi:MAG: DUF2520 domain-containing protein [Bacteroidales bacterium]|nr:DUF2520 domain-containing protein [Bacteroidales bacterium]
MVCLLGSGNVATWIAGRLRGSSDFPVRQVYSRHLDHAQVVADLCGAEALDDLSKLDPNCRIFIFALSDDALPKVLSQIPFKMPLAVHTAGSIPQEIFAPYADYFGVLYPLQTFSKTADMSALKVPLCVETGAADDQADMLMKLASELSDIVRPMDSGQRFYAHLASVFACNFSNAMCQVADDILRQHDLDIELILPLMEQTVHKLYELSPKEAQTGPARRGDLAVMRKHLEALPDERWREIYRMMSDFIIGKDSLNADLQ